MAKRKPGSGCVYLAENMFDGKKYVGKSIHGMIFRSKSHIQDAMRGSNCYFKSALRKHGYDAFVWSILFQSNDEKELFKMECKFIEDLDTLAPNGYNLTTGGEGGVPCDETRRKRSEKQSGAGNPMYGKKHSPETIEKIRESKIGKPSGAKGVPKTADHKKKLSEANKGKRMPEDVRQKISGTLKGQMTGEKNPMYGKKMSEDAKVKSRESHKLRKENMTDKERQAECKRVSDNLKRANQIRWDRYREHKNDS